MLKPEKSKSLQTKGFLGRVFLTVPPSNQTSGRCQPSAVSICVLPADRTRDSSGERDDVSGRVGEADVTGSSGHPWDWGGGPGPGGGLQMTASQS